jgi:hypothetical protein
VDGWENDPRETGANDGDRMLLAWLVALPPDEPPDGFYERIEAALGIAPSRASRARRERHRGRVRNAARAVSWLVRGPARGAAATPGLGGVRAGISGFGAARWALGPLARRPAGRPLWQRVLGLGG